MFDDSQVLIPYQLSGDCLAGLSSDAVAGGSNTSDPNASKEAADKQQQQLLQYNPTLDFSELLDASLDDSSMVANSERDYLSEWMGVLRSNHFTDLNGFY